MRFSGPPAGSAQRWCHSPGKFSSHQPHTQSPPNRSTKAQHAATTYIADLCGANGTLAVQGGARKRALLTWRNHRARSNFLDAI